MKLEDLVAQSLQEDAWKSDVTTKAVERTLLSKDLPTTHLVNFVLIAKEPGVFSGADWVQALVRHCQIELEALALEGEVLKKGQTVLSARAPWVDVLGFERTLLNGLQYLCGIATQTASYVGAVESAARKKGLKEIPGVYHTRKILPLMRDLSVQAVLAGGGKLHRKTLADRVLSKENHKYVLQSLGLGFKEYVSELSQSGLLSTALIEVESLAEAQELLGLGVQNLLLDNFSPAQVAEALKFIPSQVSVEISGGLHLENLGNYIQPGVHRLSVGALTHSVKALDLSLDFNL